MVRLVGLLSTGQPVYGSAMNVSQNSMNNFYVPEKATLLLYRTIEAPTHWNNLYDNFDQEALALCTRASNLGTTRGLPLLLKIEYDLVFQELQVARGSFTLGNIYHQQQRRLQADRLEVPSQFPFCRLHKDYVTDCTLDWRQYMLLVGSTTG